MNAALFNADQIEIGIQKHVMPELTTNYFKHYICQFRCLTLLLYFFDRWLPDTPNRPKYWKRDRPLTT